MIFHGKNSFFIETKESKTPNGATTNLQYKVNADIITNTDNNPIIIYNK
ncbi:hypothetical protein [Ehrlichia ruminantium]|nr:hypothetical protein [Ehrlichia ruminantium]